MNLEALNRRFSSAVSEIGRVVVGQEALVEAVVIALMAGGHVLIEGVPGLGKTLLVRALAQVMGAQFKRIQFTPDLMPSDVTGGNVFDAKKGEFTFVPGPIFTQLLLGDEINRAPPKTQSALLEAMQDSSVSADGVTRPLPEPFFVVATQNPVESQGTYPLPEAQLDRFLFKLNVEYPTRAAERKVLDYYLHGFDSNDLEKLALEPVLPVGELPAMRALLAEVRVEAELLDYVIDIVARSRAHNSVYLGASPRASIGLLLASRVRAAVMGREFVVPDDVKSLASPVLRHRLILHPDAELEGTSPDDVVSAILREAPVPKGAT